MGMTSTRSEKLTCFLDNLTNLPGDFRWLPVDGNKKQVFGNGWQTHGGYKLGELIHFRKDFEGLALITGSGSRAAVIDMDGPGVRRASNISLATHSQSCQTPLPGHQDDLAATAGFI